MLKAAWRAPSWSWASVDAAIEYAWYSKYSIIRAPEPLVDFVDFPKDVCQAKFTFQPQLFDDSTIRLLCLCPLPGVKNTD